jgi:hypothetical protein
MSSPTLKKSIVFDGGDDNVSIVFSVDPDMYRKLDIIKHAGGNDYTPIEQEKIYRYQLEKDIAKIVERRGHYQDRNENFLQNRSGDRDYQKVARGKKTGKSGKFNVVSQLTMQASWRLTSKPDGEIAQKHEKERQEGIRKDPDIMAMKDKEQRLKDQELWARVM